jgi:hypothetical protein
LKTVEVYVSTDTETDGPVPGLYSLLSLASAAYSPTGELLGTFSANLETLPDAQAHPQTMAWWESQQEAWNASRQNLQAPEQVMKDYLAWLESLPGQPIFVGFPAAYDFMFVQWYLVRFTGEMPFQHAALDIKTYAMAVLKVPYNRTTKRNLPKRWHSRHPHTHQALDDAIEQGCLFINMLTERLADPPPEKQN